MANPLMARLQTQDKKGLFKRTQTSVSYMTGLLPFDYRNGYTVEVRDMDDKLVESYSSLGLVGGTFVTVAGKSGTAKTSWAIGVAANIVKPFDAGMVLHFDLEQALSYTRIRAITGYSSEELNNKYILKGEDSYIEDIFDSIIAICNAKQNDPETFKYDTGLKNEFNEPIRMYVPTVVIVDSLPMLSPREDKLTDKEIEGSTYAARVSKVITQFYRRLMPLIKKFNITVICINHITAKMEVSAFAKSQPDLMYLKIDESLPGGRASLYLANNVLKFVSMSPKLTMEEHGVDGFKVRCELLKSRTNKAGQHCVLVYDQDKGFDPVLTQLEYASINELVEGRNPYLRFTGFPDVKFNRKTFREQYVENPELREALMKCTIPLLERNLNVLDPTESDQHIDPEKLYKDLFEGIREDEDKKEE